MSIDNNDGGGGRRFALLGLQRFLAIRVPEETAPTNLLTYEDALRIGQKLCERWPIFAGRPAPCLDEHGWADLVLFVLRSARDSADDTCR